MKLPEYPSRPDGSYLFGVVSDTHHGSKYHRADVLKQLYQRFSDAKVDRVFHAGNWIEGEAPFNKHELTVHGLEPQIRYLARNYPKIGVKTYAVTGDDHEGWSAKREGIDVGQMAQDIFASYDRDDWVNLGYQEAYVRLVNQQTQRSSYLLLVHPGGGSAYALSYAAQKYIESLSGGEKPAVAIFGHWHKLGFFNLRNCWVILAGSTKDQDSFLRKNKIESHLGGLIVELNQDQRTGAITGCKVELMRYFNKGYYNKRFSPFGEVSQSKI